MNYRKTLAAFAAVAGLMCATEGYAKTNVSLQTEKESAIAVWFNALFLGGADVRKLTGTERPPCQAKSGRATSANRGCEEVEPVEDPVPACSPKVGSSLPPCRHTQPCAGRQCIEPEPGP
jgi:hypothetical protein